jgi:diacylglycerol kinase (ATP)
MSQPKKTCVVYNPASGRGRALTRIDGRRACIDGEVDVVATTGPGDAEQIAERAASEGCVRIVAAGGDGTVHEVANGIIRSGNPDVAFAVWPMGSANDYAYSLGLTGDPFQQTETHTVDVGKITGPDGRHRYFVNGMGLGFNGGVTVEARRIRWLRGMSLYGLAMLRAMVRHFKKPLMHFKFDDSVRDSPTLALTLNLGKREGGFPLTPRADLSDGYFDYMHAGPVSRLELLLNFPNLIRGTLPDNHPRMWLGRCRSLALRSEAPLRIHLDGEFFCQPEDGVESVEVEMLSNRLRVEAARVETPSNR